jgi:inward rectifier potassium channel
MARRMIVKKRETTQHFSIGGLELGKIGVSRFDWRDPYHFALTISWPAFVLYLFAAYVLITSAFAVLYLANPGSVANARSGHPADAFFFSIETLATVGYGEMTPANLVGHVIATGEIITGMAFTAIMTGLIFVRFSKPRSKVLFAEKAVIATHNGARTLMLRIGNGRVNVLTDVRAQLNLLLKETSHEGQVSRNAYELKLARDHAPVFPLTMTLMHPIDALSPLAGRDQASLEESEIRLFVSVEARDPALGAVVHDLRTYAHQDILLGYRYLDAVSVDEFGRPVADLRKISLIAEDEHMPLDPALDLHPPVPVAGIRVEGHAFAEQPAPKRIRRSPT